MENFGQTMPVSAVRLLMALLQRQQVHPVQNIFQKLLCVVKINSHCMKFFICIKGLHQGSACHLALTFSRDIAF